MRRVPRAVRQEGDARVLELLKQGLTNTVIRERRGLSSGGLANVLKRLAAAGLWTPRVTSSRPKAAAQ